MSTAEILSLISLISYILAGVCLVLAILFWFVFKIPSVIGDLSGRTAKKAVAKMWATSPNKSKATPSAPSGKGKTTPPVPPKKKQPAADEQATEVLQPNAAVPAGEVVTGVLGTNAAMPGAVGGTEKLDYDEATGRLEQPEKPLPQPVRRTGGKQLVMINEVMLIHTDEVIS